MRGIGTQGGVKMIIEDRSGKADYQRLEKVAQNMVAALHDNADVSDAFESFNTKTPRIYAQIDRVKSEYLGVPDSQVFDTLQTFLGSSYINDFNYLNHTYQVYAQADAPVQAGRIGGRPAPDPLGQRGDDAAVGGGQPEADHRSLSGLPLPALSRRRRSRRTRRSATPPARRSRRWRPWRRGPCRTASGYEWTELAYQQQAAGNTATLVFVLAVVLIFLLLAALYESVTMPLAVILIVPMCLLAAITGVNIMGMDNNILTQIGFIVLIGLAAKNAILIVEFARQGELEQGHDRVQAASEAARTRLRPILMTSLAFILGVIPLAFASGAGAELRRALGVAVFFGMIGVTVFGLLFTPVFYVVTRKLSEKLPQPRKDQRARDGGTAAGAHPEPQPRPGE